MIGNKIKYYINHPNFTIGLCPTCPSYGPSCPGDGARWAVPVYLVYLHLCQNQCRLCYVTKTNSKNLHKYIHSFCPYELYEHNKHLKKKWTNLPHSPLLLKKWDRNEYLFFLFQLCVNFLFSESAGLQIAFMNFNGHFLKMTQL